MAWIPLIMFVVVCLVLLSGYPVAFALGGTARWFATPAGDSLALIDSYSWA